MSKELEHLKILEDWANEHHNSKEVWKHSIPVQEALQRLETIENAKPSNVMECLDRCYDELCSESAKDNEFNTIKQALLKLDFLEDAIDLPTNCFSTFKNRNGDKVTVMRKERYEEYQEQEKVIEIIKELISKHCKIELINDGTYYQIRIKVMGSGYTFGMSITEEEFKLLKRWRNEQNNK